MAVSDALALARKADGLIRQNLCLVLQSGGGSPGDLSHLTPLIAVLAMSSLSILVILNALRLGRTSLS